MSEWISVTERLPEDGEDVLISVKKEIRAFDTSGYIAIASRETRQICLGNRVFKLGKMA